MENWGLITYRLTALLYDEHESSSANKQRVVEVIAHELAHQVRFQDFKCISHHIIISSITLSRLGGQSDPRETKKHFKNGK